MSDRKTAASTEPLPLMLLGLDDSAKPRGAKFPGQQANVVKKAAESMGLACKEITQDLADVAKKLPKGKVYASGQAFVPNLRKDVFAKVIQAAGLTFEGFTPPIAPKPLVPTSVPQSWGEITAGSLVLCDAGAGAG